MPLTFAIPGRPLELAHVLFDLNGTLTDRGRLIAGVPERLERLRDHVTVRLLSADTFGTLTEGGRSPRPRAAEDRRRR